MDLLQKEHFKGGGRGGGRSKGQTMNNGGIVGSGIFGMIGTTVQCRASDNSYYCNFMKFIQVLMWIGILFCVVYFLFPSLFSRKSKR